MTATPEEEQLVSYLADLHAIERQALVQMKAAPAMAGDDSLAAAFERHQGETEGQEQRVRQRLEAYGAAPSTVKDLAAWGGGAAMALFARLQPQTPGKLAVHAYSYEHMEVAAYELLKRIATRFGDHETAVVAATNAAEERRMAERIAENFDAALNASFGSPDEGELREQILAHLADAHAIERQAEKLLESAAKASEDEQLAQTYRDHLLETREHQKLVEARLEELGGSPSLLKDAALRAGALNLRAFFGVQPDTTAKLAGFAYAFEFLEVGAYELLSRLALRVGDERTAAIAERILGEEHVAAERIAAASWGRAERLTASA